MRGKRPAEKHELEFELLYFLFVWGRISVQPSHQEPAATDQHVSKEFDWLISDRGPFHHSRSYLSFVERLTVKDLQPDIKYTGKSWASSPLP